MTHRARWGLSAVLAAGMMFLATPAANAEAGMCDSGYACGYEHLTYGGGMFGTQKGTANWNWQGFGNTATSVSANGKACQTVRYYESWSPWTNLPSGKYFTMYSRQRLGYNYRDPDLRNGAGYDGQGLAYGYWNDNIEATVFQLCS